MTKTVQQILHQPKYFDFAAASPVHPDVLAAMLPYFSEHFHNPSAEYQPARLARQAVNQARESVAQTLGVKPNEIIFTAGASESISLAIRGVLENYSGCPEVAISDLEHDAVKKTAQKYPTTILPVDEFGIVDLDSLDQLLAKNAAIRLVSIILASNEIGTIQPIQKISQIIARHNQNRPLSAQILLHTDASQAPLYLDVNPIRLGVDLMTLNGGKIYGPKQSAILYLRNTLSLKPLISGGGQEFGWRAGTENVAFAQGFAKALQLAEKGRQQRVEETAKIRDYLFDELQNKFDVQLYGHPKRRLANNLMVGFQGADNERMAIALDLAGFAVSIGSACHAASGQQSSVLHSLGLSEKQINSALRLTINHYTTPEDCDDLVSALQKAYQA